MPLGELFDEPTDTRQELMGATYCALCEHGYAELTIQRISDQFPKSKSLLYHHYDSKDELLVEFLSFVLEHLESTIPEDDDEPLEALESLLDHLLPTDPSAEQQQFIRAIVELRAQAASTPAYQTQFTRSTECIQNRLVAIINRGQNQGVFRPLEADQLAAFVVATIDGAMIQQATTDSTHTHSRVRKVRTELETCLEARLIRSDTEATE